MMASFGNTEEQIAKILAIDPKTLRAHYRAELDLGHVKASNAVAANLFRLATKDDPKAVTAAQFWLRCRAGWSEYSPAPAASPARERELGKKEQAALAAETAAADTSWDELIRH
ncbi:RNA polymerase subunit sigma-70 [Methylobacterium oxalidis]|uniref:RNA polymerase subunit sigma-70 n=1 Tax=Methylobacterium oxalidis TaxID=944322 RepID=UPI003314837C